MLGCLTIVEADASSVIDEGKQPLIVGRDRSGEALPSSRGPGSTFPELRQSIR
jgi:hypothetical protein